MSVLDSVAASSDRLRMDRGALQIDPVPRVSIQAFCETPEVAGLVTAAIADRRMAKAHVKQNMGARRQRLKPIRTRQRRM